MTARELTRRSLLAAAAGAVAGGVLRPRAALAATESALEQAAPILPAGGGQPPIIVREAWARGSCTPRVAPEYGAVRMAFVHHTENPNGYGASAVPAMLRAIFLFHRDTNGWNDIGYNFVIDRFGRIFEARAGGIDEAVTGAQAGGYNYCSTGIAVLGEYGAQRISPAARAALVPLLAWKLALHGVPIEGRVTVRVNPAGAGYSRFPANARVSLPRVAGHCDADATECPGDALYGELASVRLSAARLQGAAARVTLLMRAPANAPTPQGAPTDGTPGASGTTPGASGTTPGASGTTPGAPGTTPGAPAGTTPGGAVGAVATLGGHLMFLGGVAGIPSGGAPISGAPIEIQARSVSRRGEVVRELTVAQTRTAADGSWSLPLYVPAPGAPEVAAGTWLRALCPGAAGTPAAVSEGLSASGAFAFTPPASAVAPAATPASPAPVPSRAAVRPPAR